MPFYRWSLIAARPIPGYPESLEHIGHHILRRRLDLGLQQKQAARQIGVHPGSLENWEHGRARPVDRVMPAVIRFLGYNPLPSPGTTGKRVAHQRTRQHASSARSRLLDLKSSSDRVNDDRASRHAVSVG